MPTAIFRGQNPPNIALSQNRVINHCVNQSVRGRELYTLLLNWKGFPNNRQNDE